MLYSIILYNIIFMFEDLVALDAPSPSRDFPEGLILLLIIIISSSVVVDHIVIIIIIIIIRPR